MTTSRRDFLKIGSMGVSISFLAPQLFAREMFGTASSADRILVVLQLAGGNDAVNTFIPYTESKYRSLRPNLAIADSDILKVDDRIGFHPSLAALVPLYQQRKFAFVNNVGFASLDRSHFRCQDVWQTADDSYGQTQRGVLGWLGRYADLYLSDSPETLATVTIGSKAALGMKAAETVCSAIPGVEAFDVLTDARYPADRESFVSTLRSIYMGSRADEYSEEIRKQGTDMFGSIDLVKALPAASSVTYPATPLGNGLKLVAQMIAADYGTHAVWVSTGGYDTHSTQSDQHADLLKDVADSLAAFYADIAQRGISKKVSVLAWSEFGRRIQENASLGTDHGKAGSVLLLGDDINGGTFYGGLPSLSDLDEGDLRTGVDFRAVYSTLISDFYGKDPEPVLGARYENLGFVTKEAAPVRRRGIRR